MGKLFGTDGCRGIVNDDLSIDLAIKIGVGVARILKEETGKQKLKFLVGSDTRLSKDMLTNAVCAGVLSEGCDIVNLGVLPTPAISYLVKKEEADGAFVISASHNPSEYNGIKVLDGEGFKLKEELEEKIEEFITDNFSLNNKINDNGKYSSYDKAKDDYIDHLINTIDCDLSDINIIVDTANGAASEVADALFKRLNANYKIINNEPNGLNINENAGSTHIDGLISKVKEGNYDIGIAYDGDADRCILVDELGNEIDGDFILAIAGSFYLKNNKLKNNTLVGTVMSNLGLVKFCEENNINFCATKVGDKYVLDEMQKNDFILGGEQSGHIIFKEYANTGDGELTSLQILRIMAKTGKKLSELAKVMNKYPQVMKNVKVSKEGKENYSSNKFIEEKINLMEKELNGDGRILVRPSGTENLIRVMLEGKDIEKITNICDELVSVIEKELN